jgi:hypothetical protein
VEAAVTQPKTSQNVRHDHAGVEDEQQQRDKGMDKTLADSYPASDPPSTIPDPDLDENAA